jgi:hypothetical protein
VAIALRPEPVEGSAAAPVQITTMAPFEKLPPYGNNTLPAGVHARLVPNVNGLTVNMLEAGAQGGLSYCFSMGFRTWATAGAK